MRNEKIALFVDTYFSIVAPKCISHYWGISVNNILIIDSEFSSRTNAAKPERISTYVNKLVSVINSSEKIIIACRKKTSRKKIMDFVLKYKKCSDVLVIDTEIYRSFSDLENDVALPTILLINGGGFTGISAIEFELYHFFQSFDLNFCQIFTEETTRIIEALSKSVFSHLTLMKQFSSPKLKIKSISFDFSNDSGFINDLLFCPSNNSKVVYVIAVIERGKCDISKLFNNFSIKFGRPLNAVIESPFSSAQIYDGINICAKASKDFNVHLYLENGYIKCEYGFENGFSLLEKDLINQFCLPNAVKRI